MKAPAITVLFDGECPLCQAYARRLRSWDWLGRVRLVPIQSPEAPSLAPGIPASELTGAMHCVGNSGEVRKGVGCLRWVGLRVPLLLPLALLLYLPGALWLADPIYGWISRHRHALSRACGRRP